VELSTRTTLQRIGFFAAGVLFSFATFYVGFRWPELYELVFRGGFNYASQPAWYRISGTVVGYLPLISVAVITLLRVAYKRAVRPVSYSIGVGTFYAALVALLIVAGAHSPF